MTKRSMVGHREMSVVFDSGQDDAAKSCVENIHSSQCPTLHFEQAPHPKTHHPDGYVIMMVEVEKGPPYYARIWSPGHLLSALPSR
jgi:hypothetical protein